MKTRAAVAFAAKQPLEIGERALAGPKAGEVLGEIRATGICHTDAYPLDGLDSEGLFLSVLGHEGAGIVREIGAGVISLVLGDHVIPLHTPQCRQCKSCLSGKTNQCTAIRATQGQSVIDPMITHILTLEEINKGSALSHAGEFIRSGVGY